jgi:hypothetical protein
MMKSVRVGQVAVAVGTLGVAVALWALLPLPPASDIYAARDWGLGASYVGFILGFPFGVVLLPLAVAIHPFPAGGDASGAGAMAAMVAGIVGLDWAGWAALVAALVRAFRGRRARSVAQASRPPA